MSRVAFTRFCRQIHQSARIWVGLGWVGGDQANLGNARIFIAPITKAPPLVDMVILEGWSTPNFLPGLIRTDFYELSLSHGVICFWMNFCFDPFFDQFWPKIV